MEMKKIKKFSYLQLLERALAAPLEIETPVAPPAARGPPRRCSSHNCCPATMARCRSGDCVCGVAWASS